MESARLSGMNRWIWFLVFGLLIFGFVSGGEEKISVIIMSENAEQVENFAIDSNVDDIEITHKYSSFDGFSAEIYASDLNEFKKEFGNAVFIDDRKYRVSLDFSAPQIGANDAWELESSGTILDGAGQTICIIDTGVNYSHPALGGCYGNNNPISSCRVLGGYDYIGDDSDPFDDHGHGTHVAGIAISNDSIYKGIAPNAKIIAMKVLDSSGSSQSGSDVIAAIDWCVSNASAFNISVISMSLGDDSTYNSYCVSAPWDSAINAAVAVGIPVVIAAGNCDQPGQLSCTTGVAMPACIESATRVGAVDDADAISYMRGALFELMAPGVGIISTLYSGGVGSKSGTSMSTPHISGSIALIKQHLEMSGQDKSVDEIEIALNNSGVRIDDSAESGYNFTRINIYDALLSLDNIVPVVEPVSPIDNNLDLNSNQSFICNVSDWQIENVTFRIWNSSGLYYNKSQGLTGEENSTSFDLVGLEDGEYVWRCEAWDLVGNFNFSSNFSLTVGGVEISLSSPFNNSFTSLNETNFNCSGRSDDSYKLTNMTFRLWNSSGVLVYNESQNVSGVENVTNFNFTFLEEDNYVWGCVVSNNNSDQKESVNFSIRYDVTGPVISELSVDAGINSAVISWTTDEISNSSAWVSGGSWANSSDNVVSHSISISGLSSSTSYNYLVWTCDMASNCENISGSFTTGSSGGGGGDSGSSGVSSGGVSSVKQTPPVIHEVRDVEFSLGYSKNLKKGDGLVFRFDNLDNNKHSLTVEEVDEDYVDLVVQSDPVEVRLFVGKDRKLNLSSPDYYDLFIKLEDIPSGVANLTIKKISEPIFEVVEETTMPEKNSYDTLIWVVIILVAVFLVAFGIRRKKIKKKKHKKYVVVVRHSGHHGENKKIKT